MMQESNMPVQVVILARVSFCCMCYTSTNTHLNCIGNISIIHLYIGKVTCATLVRGYGYGYFCYFSFTHLLEF